jgi:hypothetical protein
MEQENVYVYFAAFLRAAKKAGWSKEEINVVLEDARSSDYDHAVGVLLSAAADTEQEITF